MSYAEANYWVWFGTLYLIYLTYEDYKNHMMVDDRKNYFMMGLSISLFSHFFHTIWYTLAVTGFFVLFVFLAKKYLVRADAFGEADINSLGWMFFGFAIISPMMLLMFALVFGLISVAYTVIKTRVFKRTEPTPFYAVLLISYVAFGAIWGLY